MPTIKIAKSTDDKYQDGSKDIPQNDEDDHGYQDNDDEGDDPYHQDHQDDQQEVIKKDPTTRMIDKRVIKKDPTKEIPTITINKKVINMVKLR